METLIQCFGAALGAFEQLTMVINHLLNEMIPQVRVYAMYIQPLTDMLF